MVHVRYAVNDRALVRGAYTESIARADFASLVPFIATDGDDAEAGNPELESAHSKNIDLMLEYYPAGLVYFLLVTLVNQLIIIYILLHCKMFQLGDLECMMKL